jgi:hypothetical protein
LAGDVGFGYEIEGTTNFADWVALTNTTNFGGLWRIQDGVLLPQRIYRARQLP